MERDRLNILHNDDPSKGLRGRSGMSSRVQPIVSILLIHVKPKQFLGDLMGFI